MVSPSQKKSAVAHAVPQRLCSVRRACTYLSLPRSTYRYIPKPLTDRREQLYQRNHCFILASSALWLPPHPRLVGKRGLDGKFVSKSSAFVGGKGLKYALNPRKFLDAGALPGYRLRLCIVITYGPGISSLIGPTAAVR